MQAWFRVQSQLELQLVRLRLPCPLPSNSTHSGSDHYAYTVSHAISHRVPHWSTNGITHCVPDRVSYSLPDSFTDGFAVSYLNDCPYVGTDRIPLQVSHKLSHGSPFQLPFSQPCTCSYFTIVSQSYSVADSSSMREWHAQL